jgi:hypothetical protein
MDLQCKWCNETKPEDLFVKCRAAEPYSARNIKCCRQCWSNYQKERYKRPDIKAKQLRANASWRKAHPDEMARYAKKFIGEKPAQQQARNRVGYLLREGIWKRRACELCASMTQVEAHHDSYAPPHWETVRWLCKAHHETWHQALDPVKNAILEEPMVEVAQWRDEAIVIQAQITALRDRHRELHSKSNALELATWNKVIEAATPLFEEFAKTA